MSFINILNRVLIGVVMGLLTMLIAVCFDFISKPAILITFIVSMMLTACLFERLFVKHVSYGSDEEG